ncbi:MAG: Lnb N-terminal periplasmic domain-containing protein [Prevotella sp.]
MEYIKYKIKAIFFVILFFVSYNASAQESLNNSIHLDSVEISLLTCAPHDQIYSLYGHTALRVLNKETGDDVVVNYGMFSFKKPYFILRFVFGLTDYEMGIEPFEYFVAEYATYGSEVVQQKLNLTNEDKQQIISALQRNADSNNKVYRYNYFYNNCTTRARNILLDNINGKVQYWGRKGVEETYRDVVHRCTENHLWARFGNDLLLGVMADKPLSFEQKQFLPHQLMVDFAAASIASNEHVKRKLVAETTQILPDTEYSKATSKPIRPLYIIIGVFSCVVIASLLQLKSNVIMWYLDTFLLLITGLSGLILFAMLFSQHPTVQLNFQILLLNPLSIILLWSVVSKEKKHKSHSYWRVLAGFILLFMFLGLFQAYAEGMYFLALSLLIRCMVNIKYLDKVK